MALSTLASYFKQRFNGGPAGPASPFRVGMVVTMDPTPFILAGSTTKLRMPKIDAQDSVTAVGLLQNGQVQSHRLYLPDGKSFLHVVADRTGQITECRFFQEFDTVYPPQEEWPVWLDATDGLIGLGQFQTLDGKLYDRHWNRGATRVPPQVFTETYTHVDGGRPVTLQRTHHAMLYSAGTGLPAPAPQAEYILVAAVEQSTGAKVSLYAGLDFNPASFSLA